MTAQEPKPSVLIINRVFPPERGATGRLVRDLSLAFAKDGWHVNVLCSGNIQSVERHKNNDIRVHRIKAPLKNKSAWRYMKILWRLYKAGRKMPRHDLVISMTDPPMLAVAAARIARKHKSAHIHWCQDLYPDLLPVLGFKTPLITMKILRMLSRRAMKSCERIVVIGRDMAHYLIDEGIDSRRISVIPNWPNIELTRPLKQGNSISDTSKYGDAAAKDNPNGKNGFNSMTDHDIRTLQKGQEPVINLFKDKNNPRFRILYAGSIGLAHPIDTILDAAEILNSENPEIEFVFVGDGPGFERISEQRAFRELANIRLIPSQPAHRLRELMESGDVHIISMTEKSCGLLVPSKLYSALASARPTIFIGPKNSEVARVLTDFKAGVAVDQGDAEQLANLIKHYRYDSDAWFAAQNGAAEAGQSFVPRESLIAWLKRSRAVLRSTQDNNKSKTHDKPEKSAA